jgi:hypothetical protein
MSEKIGYGESRNTTVIRTPVLDFKLIRWDWERGKQKDTTDITASVLQFSWLKSTRNPDASCTITMIPQYSSTHLLDFISPMDVIEIREFGTLKYQGFVRRISASGSISSTGAPNRSATVQCSSFGALLSEGGLGLNMFLKTGTYTDMRTSIAEFSGSLADIIKNEKSTYSTMITAVIDKWLKFLDDNGANKYKNYFTTFINYKDGMGGKMIPGSPKNFTMFYGTEQNITLWSILTKMIESPFNELWFDCGKRKVWVEKNDRLTPPSPSEIDLIEEKNYLIIRSPPYNGTVIKGVEKNLWDTLSARKIPLSYLTKFDFSKSMDESYSFYLVSPALYDPGELALVASGDYQFDQTAFNKYLYRPMIHDLYYSRLQKPETTELDKKKDTYTDIGDKALTLLKWNEHNDKYLSGTINMMVPSNEVHDPRIGDKIELEGISDAYFYVEGVSHTWTYGGTLSSTVSVTRGWGNGAPIKLEDRIFKRGKFNLSGGF